MPRVFDRGSWSPFSRVAFGVFLGLSWCVYYLLVGAKKDRTGLEVLVKLFLRGLSVEGKVRWWYVAYARGGVRALATNFWPVVRRGTDLTPRSIDLTVLPTSAERTKFFSAMHQGTRGKKK